MSHQFILFIDDTRATVDWRGHLASRIRLRTIEREHGNVCEIEDNRDHDPTRIGDPEEGYLFFRWRLHCWPDKTRTKAEQMELARYLREVVEQTGCRVVVGANFEGEL